MKILMGPLATYSEMLGNRGMTAAAIIETSHVVLHTWDECDPAILQLDVYSCSPFSIDFIISELDFFSPTKIEYKFLDREHSLIEVNTLLQPLYSSSTEDSLSPFSGVTFARTHE